jgi:hypothetical protein
MTEEERYDLMRDRRNGETLHQWVLRIMGRLQEMTKDDLSTTLFNILKEAYIAGASSNEKGKKNRKVVEGEFILLQHQAAQDLKKELEDGKPETRLEVYIKNTPLTPRATNALQRAGVKTLGDLVQLTKLDITNIRGLGQAGLFDIEEMLKTYGLQLRRIHKDVL